MPAHRPRTDAKTLRAIRDLRRSGWKAEDLAALFDVPLSTYYRWAHFLDVAESKLAARRSPRDLSRA